MSTPETDPHTDLLKSIAASLKGIHTSLEQLTGAVEGVTESIEKAHEPEGDLGVHLVGALKDLSSTLQKRAQQERSQQPQQGQHRQNQQQGRRDRHPRQEDRQTFVEQEEENHRGYREPAAHPDEPSSEEQPGASDPGEQTVQATENKASQPQEKSARSNSRGRRRGNGRGGKLPADK